MPARVTTIIGGTDSGRDEVIASFRLKRHPAIAALRLTEKPSERPDFTDQQVEDVETGPHDLETGPKDLETGPDDLETGVQDVETGSPVVDPPGVDSGPPACRSYIDWSDDHFNPNLTVRETLQVYASLKALGPQRVERILDVMGLRLCQDTRVGDLNRRGISTGERRRLAIAAELMDVHKQVLFINRPTTGLDSAHGRSVMDTLASIARQENRTIIVALDQPSSAVLNASDDVVLLHQRRVACQGSPGELLQFLQEQTRTESLPEGHGTADFVLDVMDRMEDDPGLGEAIIRAYAQSPQAAAASRLLAAVQDRQEISQAPRLQAVPVKFTATDGTHGKCSPALKKSLSRTATLTKRCFIDASRTSMTWVPLLIAVIQGLLMGVIMFRYDKDLPTYDSDTAAVIDPTVWTSPLYELITSGVARNAETQQPVRPLLDVFTDGVDGHGNNWIYDLINYSKEVSAEVPTADGRLIFKEGLKRLENGAATVQDHYALLYLRQIIQCTATKWKLEELGYPSLAIEPSSDSQLDPALVISDLLQALQLVDYLWNRLDWTSAASCGKNNWICLASRAGGLADDVFTCGGFKSLPTVIGVSFTGRPAVIPFDDTRAESRGRRATAGRSLEENGQEVYDILQWLRDYSDRSKTNKYEGEIAEFDFTVSQRYWKRFGEVTKSLVPGWTLPELIALLLSPNTHGDLAAIDGWDKVEQAAEFVQHLWEWANSEKSAAIFPTGPPATATEPSPAGSCNNEFCQLVKLSTVRFVRRVVNRAKIEGFLRLFPRLVVNAWAALTATGALFALTAALAFFCVDVLLSFATLRTQMNREVNNGLYRPLEAFMARNLVDLPFQVLPAVLLALIWSAMSGLVVDAAAAGVLLGVSSAVLFATYGVCYAISAATPRMEVAMVVAPLLLMSWVIISGFIMRSSELLPWWTRWFRYTSFHRFGWFAAMVNAFPTDGSWGDIPSRTVLWVMGVPDSTNVGTEVWRLVLIGLTGRVIAGLAFQLLYRGAGITAESKCE